MESLPPFDRSHITVTKKESVKDSSDIRKILELQRMVVQQNLHQMVSPLNAIQGYLELMDSASEANQAEKKRYYKKQIETGLDELHKILHHIHELYETKVSDKSQVDVNESITGVDTEDLQTNDAKAVRTSDYVDGVVNSLRTTDHYLDVDLNWIIRDGLKKFDNWSDYLNLDLAKTGTHVLADVYLIRVVVHEFLRFMSLIQESESVTVELKSHSDETYVYLTASLSNQIGLESWSTNEQLPLSQYHRWLDLTKSLELKTDTTDQEFTMKFPRA
jgi:hypothetical protein